MTDNDSAPFDAASGGNGDAADLRRLALLGAPIVPTNWRSLSSAESSAAWRDLRGWVEWFRREFVLDHRVVPPCWYLHAALVSVLSALHDHWRYAYDPLNSLLGPSDWHRGFIQLEQRMRDWASRTGCTGSVHRPDVVVAYPDKDAEWAAHVAADAAARAATEAASDARGDDRG